ncbi:uncharacterized protein LOC111681440 [Lucilia cuprina]|uniref:uncharacterized protein LOC111681440 n=1 Tax=Lucilia cuprina TaxID=7375 RepID=UPI001F06FFDA|nr:uncharacterized protein LOC111681440 [Lucilia cuprina]
MSRFGLRSCSDGLKLLEEKNNRRKASNPTSISTKRILTQKESKFSTQVNNNEENLIDDIKIESDEVEKCSDTSDKLAKNKNTGGVGEDDDDDDDEDNNNDNENDDDDDYRQQSPICKGTLVCSLPLDRINEIIQKLNLNKAKIENEKESDEIMIEETLDNDDDEEEDANISKQSASNIKNLCLYCDRKFSSHKMQLKHVDKFHCLQQDRRCSGRNAQLQQQSNSTSRKRKSAIRSQHFPGCNFCQKTKGPLQPVILPATELSSLFLHLTDCHTDKYFGCKTCVIRFQNISKLSKHMEVVHKTLPFAFDESSSKSKDNDTDSLVSIDKLTIGERSKLSLKRQQRSQKSLNSCMNVSGNSVGTVSSTSQCSTAIAPNTSVIGAEEPILSRLGLTQNRLPNNRKGVRLRREKLLPEMLLKSEQNHTSSNNFAFGQTTSISASSTSSTTCSPKLRGKSIKSIGGFSGDTTADVVFRVPTRNDILSCVFDDNFYKEVVSNVRNNLLFHLDGKIMGNSIQELDTSLMRHAHQPQIRSTLVKSPIVVTTMDSEIHAATSLAAITAFPTLLTAEQFGGDASSAKIRRPHTKNSWKWKWDSVKKFKLINEGGKIVKKMKHPMLGLRDLSKLDMWTQLTMRQKHELLQQQKVNQTHEDNHWHHVATAADTSADSSREEKQRLNDQLNFILDMRLLPHIILEQNEQAIIKLENDEFGIAPTQIASEDCGENFMAQTFADESFLSMLNLLPNYDTQNTRTKLVLSGEWARPRCYLCICCGAKFEKLKSLEEHKMFRHSQILSTHYEVVGRELLNGNLLRHLFIPKKALSRYGNDSDNSLIYSGAARRLFWHKNETLIREITNNEESSDSLQSVLHSCATNSPSLKNSSSCTEDCDIDSKLSTTAALQLVEDGTVVSPTHSIQSCSSSSSSTGLKRQLKNATSSRSLPIVNATSSGGNNNSNISGSGCSKCGRKCNGVLDLYRHMLDCSGDYIWSLAKKRKYRYYCGSKKRRPCNKHSILELRKNKSKTAVKPLSISNDNTTEEGAVSSSNYTKTKSSPRSRPSDAESIKKMLENLPPKRICKKIFPTLSKTKKSIKNIKPKLLAKHKIYNSLRKTRVRQMSQAAKILSKTKSQLKKPKKMATRSTASTIKTKVVKNRNNKNKKAIKATVNKSVEKKLTNENPPTNDEKLKNKLEESSDVVDNCSIKTENENVKDCTLSETIESVQTTEVETNDQILQNSSDLLISDNLKQNKEQLLSQDEKLKKISDPIETSTKKISESVINVRNITTLQEKVPLEIQDQTKAASNTTVTNIIGMSDSERNTQTNSKNVKRSKRISDCIAMLTGKLEEKLKTEQNTVIRPIQEKKSASDMSQPFKIFTPPAVPPIPIQHQPIFAMPKLADDTDNEKTSPKKTPKRKAMSRRIIKTDVSESSPLPPVMTNFMNKPLDNPKIITPIEITSVPREILLPKTFVSQQISSTQQSITTTSVKNLPEIVFAQVENKRPTNLIPTTVVASMPPPVMPPTVSGILPKMPLFIPMDNVRQPIAATHITPIGLPLTNLPVQVPVPISIENVPQTSNASISTTVTVAGGNIIPTPVNPIMTTVPAHLLAPPGLQITMQNFNATNAVAEPLNLSNSSKNVQKQSQDLSCTGVQRISGIPARRQTICGFEVRNFAIFDEMEPLDLSKKPRPEKTLATVPFPPRHIEMASLLLPPQPTLGVPSESPILGIPPLTPEALLNKPFYSNLDLLRIPQVRNPVAGQQVAVVTNEPAPPPAIIINTTPSIPQPTKVANKKRNKPQANINAMVPPPAINNVEGLTFNSIATTTTSKTNNAKDFISNTTKKESTTKNKNTLRMDEEVINHIDDAINSVINAVKASLDNEEAEKAQEMLQIKSQQQAQPLNQVKTTDDVNAPKESIAEFKYLTAARRNMRSKTLDCRPAALNKTNTKNSTVNINQCQDDTAAAVVVTTNTTVITPVVPITPNKSTLNQNNEIIKCLDNKIQINDCMLPVKRSENIKDNIETTKNEVQVQKALDLESKIVDKPSNENLNNRNKTLAEETQSVKIVENPIKEIVIETPKTSLECIAITAMPAIGQVEDSANKNIVNSLTTNTNTTINLDLEQMSNNNNTSSGFHSSAQSDQQTSVMSTTTSAVSVAATATGSDTKKKQRRRRKNELAAIVADQLLESFKLDKARRDNLKKLENLAYEKSEDLLLTGMLLMSSTKRNVASSSSNNINASTENIESSVTIKRAGKSQRNNQSIEGQKQNEVSPIENKSVVESSAVNEKSLENDKDPLEVSDAVDGKKNNKRRPYRRRGKTLDNENISKLKSSLESFSIDIERQLNEYEAKNVNVFKSVSSNESAKQSGNSKNQNSTNVNKPSIVLRPSILSVTLESGGNQEIPQTPTKIVANDSNKTVVSSRDPRLNKNIHKEGEKNNEVATCTSAAKETVLSQKNNTGPEDIGDLDEDNYLTEIAKNVNEKIMSTENEEFAFKDDGFEMVNDMGMDDSNSKFSRPPTSMSVRSAPNFNDDRSNFGSICDENTNTEVMDMDLDDEMSVYTSYSQDLGRGRGRRRRRRRSILLTRKPKKRASSRDMSAEKIECILCKKVFYSANSLSKHNMTLAHVSKVSEQEYLLSKSHSNIQNLTNSEELQTYGTLGPYARRSTRRSTISEPPMLSRCESNPSPLPAINSTVVPPLQKAQSPQASLTIKSTTTAQTNATEINISVQDDLKQTEALVDTPKSTKTLQKPTTKEQIPENEYDANISVNTAYNGNSRLNLNPDERLFFECCNILKSAETPRISNAVSTGEECNINANYSYAYNHQEKSTQPSINVNRPSGNNLTIEPSSMRTSNIPANHHQLAPLQLPNNNLHAISHQPMMDQQQTLFRDPQMINQPSCYSKPPVHDNRNARSPTYSAISHLSAVTNTTSRFKTKAAMKGYENVNIDLNQQQESKSRTICKLTELAEIALGNEEKPNSHSFSPIQSTLTPPEMSSHIIHSHQAPKANIDSAMRPKGMDTPEYVTTLVTENIRECNAQLPTRSERTKNNETRSSTSSKTIMHSSIIKAAVEEHQKAQTSNKIIIPDRPFKNIGLEEKETITFQKPKTPAVNLLTEDNNSVSTGSFSDRDDYDFGSLSCDDEVSVRESNDKNQKNNTTESSSESSRATAKTFENKSLIMGRIFKNASTKAAIKTTAVNTVKVKSVGVQKDQTPVPKADLNQLFDELRGNSRVDDIVSDRHCTTSAVEINPAAGVPNGGSSRVNHKQYQQQRENLKSVIPAASPPAVVSSTTATPPANARKPKAKVTRAKSTGGAKTRKDISKLQTELGMSPDEIKKLIDEGQRKSKRRCATNRPKKLVEMWSSDEYEEFLSTKDIIALIEEKEQQEKRKKRKNSVNVSSNTSEVAKEKENPDVTSSTKEPKRRNTRRMSMAVERPENVLLDRDEILPSKNAKAKKAVNKKEEPVSTTANTTNASELAVSQKIEKSVPEKGKGKKAKATDIIENSTVLPTTSDKSNVSRKKRSNNSVNKSKSKPTPKAKPAPVVKDSSRTKNKKRQFEDEEESNEDISVNVDVDDDDDDDDDFLISELKNKQNKTRGGKVKNTKAVASVSAAILTTTTTASAKSSTQESSAKKRGSNNNNTNCNNSNIAAGTSSNAKNQQQNQPTGKPKRKNQSNQSPPRRKRLATEKLYYWSSSSDEDFGRINNNKINHQPPENYENATGEQYQKHGWIVGDSHKKLVTLLAIAKGNKKVDSNSGVKKNIGKKRN